MKKLNAAVFAALFAAVSIGVIVLPSVSFAAEEKKAAKKPTAEECKKDPKMKGCEPAKK